MKKPLSEKEKMLTMLTEIYDQLEELESVLEASFTYQRRSLTNGEKEKLTVPNQQLLEFEKKIFTPISTSYEEVSSTNLSQVSKSLKLELGF